MTISGTYGQMQNQVADELGTRTDLLTPSSGSGLTLSPVQFAIQSAIAKWEREPFYFNEVYDQSWLTTVAGQEFYTSSDSASIATFALIKVVRVLVNANRYTLNPRTWQYIEDISVNPQSQTSILTDYAYQAETIRFYPVPSQAFPVTVTGIRRFTNLSDGMDANVWTQDAYDLIRSEAKLILATEILFDNDLATQTYQAIYGNPQLPTRPGYLMDLRRESSRRGGGGRLRPTQF